MKRFIKFLYGLLIGSVLLGCLYLYVDFIRFPEAYITTWRYHLKLDIERGDPEAIDYYNSRYVANGKQLFLQ